MFVRVKKIGAYEYLYLVENAREGGRHVQRVVKVLGRKDEVEATGMLDGLIASAARHSRRSIVLSSFYRGELAELRRVSIGPDMMFGRLWAETGCRDVLAGLLAERRFGCDVERAVYLTVLHRLMVSGSDRHASEWRHAFRVPGAEGLDLDHAYKAMAWLGEVDASGRSTAEAIEEALYRHRQPLLGEVSIAFFDTTTLWFEGAGGESLGQRGHSKDYRGHLKQVALGIVLDGEDRPIASFLLPGNTADVTLLLPVVRRLRERFGIARACIVADRGMISAETIAALEAEQIEYILGARERATREVSELVLRDDGVSVPLIIPRQKGATELAIKQVSIAGRRYVVCRNEEEAVKGRRRARRDCRRSRAQAGAGRQGADRQQGLPALREDHHRRALHHRSCENRGRCPFRRRIRPTHQLQDLRFTGGPALQKSAGGGGHLQNHQGTHGDPADLPQDRCRYPRSCVLHVSRTAAAQGTDGPPRRASRHRH